MRYAWDLQHEYLRNAGLDRGVMGVLARRTLHHMRLWDYAAAQRPDMVATNSFFVADRLWKIHRRRADVIYPPVVDTEARPASVPKGGYYLSVGRLVPYKRIDLLARAFARMPHRRLKIVGEGPDMRKIAALRAPNVELLGFQPEDKMAGLFAGADAFLFAGIEDFGIAAVEAQAAGTPVIAYNDGGLVETIIGMDRPNPTGLFFNEQSEESITAAILEFEQNAYLFNSEACVANAARFSTQRFRDEFSVYVEEAIVSARKLAKGRLTGLPVSAAPVRSTKELAQVADRAV
jgi:glycosyltransferase involved in cell wall biosynthesis